MERLTASMPDGIEVSRSRTGKEAVRMYNGKIPDNPLTRNEGGGNREALRQHYVLKKTKTKSCT
jgi:hypothetical protein